jgi:hypothetical protein
LYPPMSGRYKSVPIPKGAVMNEEVLKMLSNPTTTVETAGRLCYGLCRNTAYAAAAKGEIPTIRIGRLLKVPTAALRAKLGIVEAAAA